MMVTREDLQGLSKAAGLVVIAVAVALSLGTLLMTFMGGPGKVATATETQEAPVATAPAPAAPAEPAKPVTDEEVYRSCIAWTIEANVASEVCEPLMPLEYNKPKPETTPTPSAPTPTKPKTVQPRIYEDSPEWDCETMGNRQCGPSK